MFRVYGYKPWAKFVELNLGWDGTYRGLSRVLWGDLLRDR